MKTQLLVTIEHPEDGSVDGLINYTLNPMVHDINSDIQDGYSVTVERLDSDNNRIELENKLATIMNKKENAIEILVGRLSSVVSTEQLSVLITAEEGTQ
jgi:hypothetical protein